LEGKDRTPTFAPAIHERCTANFLRKRGERPKGKSSLKELHINKVVQGKKYRRRGFVIMKVTYSVKKEDYNKERVNHEQKGKTI
jgi:hypothetical protein